MIKRVARVGFAMDALRLWPRVFIVFYFVGGWQILKWYLNQEAASWDKSGFVTAYVSLGLPLMKWYMDNGVDWSVFLPMIFGKFKPVDSSKPVPPADISVEVK